MATNVSTRIRMHRMGELGDCFLLTFTSGRSKSHMLIDCGTFRNGDVSVAQLKKVAAAVKTELKGKPLNVVVGTHQHNDHLNGFVHCLAEFQAMKPEQVWLSWLDQPGDPEAERIGDEYNNLRTNLMRANAHLAGRTLTGKAATWRANTDALLGFFAGAKKTDDTPAVLPEQARKNLQALGSKDPAYLRPGQSVDLPGLPAGVVRVHVLGPPLKQGDLERKDPRKGESYDKELARASLSSTRFADALRNHVYEDSRTAASRNAHERPPSDLREELEYPFSQRVKVREGGPEVSAHLNQVIASYRDPKHAWRNIDNDWLEQAEGLALWLDDFTNNSSLVLAVELVAAKKVLLFAADAQTGNWSSWKDVKWADPTVSTVDLLTRTVFYKVGHHGSHNSTHKEVFDTMKNPDLVALIPVDKSDPNITKAKNPWRMPAEKLFDVLKEKTHNRVLQMDGKDDAACDPKKPANKAAWKKAGATVDISNPLYIDLTL